ncbi:hypothetical protein NEHOM01_1543 [Nematocida homosporus]|uniref:uncharacterized protein n=1 Tax=Nematocida homosporus TaxID=1912981 RepID=UPI00221F05EE|nr:uncharacterized protein NEHOM01_1543 [Nematocida homosporus]KAI5186557.1 hypothetical protein NEHOM01_1543 [Nematocida homosporus]
MSLPFVHEESLDLADMADSLLLDKICTLEIDDSLSEETEHEIYALVHFGDSESHAVSNLKRLEPVESRRYFQSTIVCYQCKNTGHTSRDCKENSTFLCSICGQGDHRRQRCPLRVCRICSAAGHPEMVCSQRFYIPTCRGCNSKTHTLPDCPGYRRYVSVWAASALVQKSCSFCGDQSHYLSECVLADDPCSVTFYVAPQRYNGRLVARPAKSGSASAASQSNSSLDKKSLSKNKSKSKSNNDMGLSLEGSAGSGSVSGSGSSGSGDKIKSKTKDKNVIDLGKGSDDGLKKGKSKKKSPR